MPRPLRGLAGRLAPGEPPQRVPGDLSTAGPSPAAQSGAAGLGPAWASPASSPGAQPGGGRSRRLAGARPRAVPAPWARSRVRSALKLSLLTLSRSSGCVQQAAPQEASPPKYHRDVRASAMARAAATWPGSGQHNSGSSRGTPGSKCHRAPAPAAANAPARPQGRVLMDSALGRTQALGSSALPLKAIAARNRGRGSTVHDRETLAASPWPPPLSRLWLGSQIRRCSAKLHSSGSWFPYQPPSPSLNLHPGADSCVTQTKDTCCSSGSLSSPPPPPPRCRGGWKPSWGQLAN